MLGKVKCHWGAIGNWLTDDVKIMSAASSLLSLGPGLFLNLAAYVLHLRAGRDLGTPPFCAGFVWEWQQFLGCSQNTLCGLLGTQW